MRTDPVSATIRVKANKLPGVPPGHVFTISADRYGVPLEEFWRRRFKDAETDNCCEVLSDQPEPELKPKSKSKTRSKTKPKAQESDK